jgi:hypothetical protein
VLIASDPAAIAVPARNCLRVIRIPNLSFDRRLRHTPFRFPPAWGGGHSLKK